MAEEKEEKGFRVSDRRRFTGEGDHREKETASSEASPPPPAPDPKPVAEKPVEKKPSAPKEAKAPESGTRAADIPEINFATFIFSLSTSVLIHLGATPDPVTGETKQNLTVAKQTIDILVMLQEKTKGNLTREEKQLLDSILYDLRMQYVAESKKAAK